MAFKFFYATSVPTFLSEVLANTLNFCDYVMRVLINQRHLSSPPLSRPFKAYWLRDAPTGLIAIVLSAHTVFMCFVFI